MSVIIESLKWKITWNFSNSSQPHYQPHSTQCNNLIAFNLIIKAYWICFIWLDWEDTVHSWNINRRNKHLQEVPHQGLICLTFFLFFLFKLLRWSMMIERGNYLISDILGFIKHPSRWVGCGGVWVGVDILELRPT